MPRWLSAGVIIFWLAAMAGLVYRDIWPHWVAGSPPVQVPNPKSPDIPRRYQSGIFTSRGRVGTSWTMFDTAGGNTLVHTQTALEGLPLLPPIVMDSKLTYTSAEKLDSIEIRILGIPMRLEFRGEDYGMDFSCELITGPGPKDRYGFKLDGAAAATMNEALRPFTLLKDLHVGKTWRMRLVNPLPAIRGGKAELDAFLVKVTAIEKIEHQGQTIDCFRVESRDVRAWAAPDGRVLVQQVDLPVFGTLTIREESFDEGARIETIQRIASGGVDSSQRLNMQSLLEGGLDRSGRRGTDDGVAPGETSRGFFRRGALPSTRPAEAINRDRKTR